MPSTSGTTRSIATVLVCAGILLAGNGLLQTLVPLRADLEGFSTTFIGVLGTAYFGGFMVGCYVGPKLIRSVGHVRCFAGSAAVLTILSLIFPIFVAPLVWAGLRLLAGISLAILFIVIESWLNDRSSNLNRGRVLSFYIIVTMAGQLMVNLSDMRENLLFTLVGMLICASIVPLALTSTITPKPIPSAKLDLRFLIALSPAGAVGCLLVGAAEGAFWSLGPVFAQERGMNVADVTVLMAAFVLGGTLSQWPLGWASDNMDRRIVIAATALGTVATGLALAFAAPSSNHVYFIIAVAHGALMVPLYALCLSHANDHAPNERMVEISGGLLLIYSIGAMIGPLAASLSMEGNRPGGLFVFIAVALGALGLFVLYRFLRARRHHRTGHRRAGHAARDRNRRARRRRHWRTGCPRPLDRERADVGTLRPLIAHFGPNGSVQHDERHARTLDPASQRDGCR